MTRRYAEELRVILVRVGRERLRRKLVVTDDARILFDGSTPISRECLLDVFGIDVDVFLAAKGR